jgi:hypothetical protein
MRVGIEERKEGEGIEHEFDGLSCLLCHFWLVPSTLYLSLSSPARLSERGCGEEWAGSTKYGIELCYTTQDYEGAGGSWTGYGLVVTDDEDGKNLHGKWYRSMNEREQRSGDGSWQSRRR